MARMTELRSMTNRDHRRSETIRMTGTAVASGPGAEWRHAGVGVVVGALVAGALLGGCSATSGSTDGAAARPGADRSSTAPAPSSPTVDPNTPTGWGPTEGELAGARGLVAEMSTAERASTVLMPGFWGY